MWAEDGDLPGCIRLGKSSFSICKSLERLRVLVALGTACALSSQDILCVFRVDVDEGDNV